MPVEFRRCLPGHLTYLHAQETQRLELAVMVTPEYAEVATSHVALSAWVGYTCIGAAGLVPVYPHRALAWALLSNQAGGHMGAIVRKMRRVIADSPFPRIEMTVSVDFENGHRLAKAVGLTLETPTPLRKHGATGNDELIYARVR